MTDETKSIHEFDFDLICEYFSNLERQGPGSPEVTIKALSFVDNLTDESRIADIGCGTGGQTRVLAQHAPGHITGIDLFPRFIDLFNSNAEKSNLQDRMIGVVASMDDLPFQPEELDLQGSVKVLEVIRKRNELKSSGFFRFAVVNESHELPTKENASHLPAFERATSTTR
jgi:SAM-dependent methyltransferase